MTVMGSVLDGDEARSSASGVLDLVYRTVESADEVTLRSCLTPDAFVLAPEAGGVLDSANAVVADLASRARSLHDRGRTLQIEVAQRLVGVTDSGSGWVFDQLVVKLGAEGGVDRDLIVRVTALVVNGPTGLRVAAAYWSVPYETQDEQDAVKHAGRLRPGAELPEGVGVGAEALVELLVSALARPSTLPGLYSVGSGAVTIGSVVDEVFEGSTGRAAWQEFVQFVSAFAPRGPIRARLVTADLGWVAANIGIGEPPTPYRFFYVWHREGEDWRIVVSHDGVSRSACAADG
jgi:hypothetical protein